MYTVVLMAALTSGSAAPDWHRHGGGCHGAVASCYGCYGSGCYGAGGYAYTGGVGIPYGGSCVGTYGGYSVTGPAPVYGCYGCWGSNSNLTVYSGPGSYGYGNGNGIPGFGISFQCHGCYGCYGGWSCYGSPTTPAVNQIIAPASPSQGVQGGGVAPLPPQDTPLPGIPMTRGEDNRVRSKVVIEVPENAKLYVDGNLMKDGPTQRVFQTPLLNPNETYFYDIRIEVTNEGKATSDTQRLVVRPGDTVTADFRTPGRPEILTASGTALQR
jgi:uncharacterized protein (TIGR03000 family)